MTEATGGMKEILVDDLFAYVDRDPKQLARRTDPTTSFEAGAKIVKKLRSLQLAVLAAHQSRPAGLTDLELEDQFSDHGSTYRTRRAELVAIGLIRDSGFRKVQAGRKRVIWQITEDGKRYAPSP
jgi:hypothetical protein